MSAVAGTVLVLNSGSSSLKFGLYDIADAPVERAMGLVERIGGQPRLKVDFGADAGRETRDLTAAEARFQALRLPLGAGLGGLVAPFIGIKLIDLVVQLIPGLS